MLQIGSLVGNVLQSLFKRPDTELYPFEKKEVPPRLRGTLVWNPDMQEGNAKSRNAEMLIAMKIDICFLIFFFINSCLHSSFHRYHQKNCQKHYYDHR